MRFRGDVEHVTSDDEPRTSRGNGARTLAPDLRSPTPDLPNSPLLRFFSVMPERPAVESEPTRPSKPNIRKIHSNVHGPTRSPLINLVIVVGAVVLVVILLYQVLIAPSSRLDTDVIELGRSIERVEELATLKSHLRFAVVVREQSGSVVVRRLAEITDDVGMSSLSSMLFQDPSMIVELHGVATYGMRLEGIGERLVRTDSSVVVPLPPPTVLDVKLVSADTRIVARMKGLFRSSNQELLAEANRQGERFVADLAAADSTLLALSAERARSLVSLLVEQSGSRAEFSEADPINQPSTPRE